LRRERLGESEAKLLVEAMLFASNRPVELRTLMRATGWRSRKELVRLLEELRREYDEQGRAFTVSELPGERYLMHLRNELLPIVRRYQRGVEGSVTKIKRVISGLVERERGSGQSDSSGSPPPSGKDQAGPNEDDEVGPVGRT
jgi:chromosome segregation and condensation protein ScpB